MGKHQIFQQKKVTLFPPAGPEKWKLARGMIKGDNQHEHTYATCDWKKKLILIDYRLTGQPLLMTVAHEVAHVVTDTPHCDSDGKKLLVPGPQHIVDRLEYSLAAGVTVYSDEIFDGMEDY